MKIVKLTSEEFENFAKDNKYVTFHQKESWGKLKENNGWKYQLVGFKDGKKVTAATLLLSKEIPMGLKMYYAPRGFLIDFKNYELLDEFVKEIKSYIKDQGGTFLKIDPYVPHLERDVNGDIVEGGYDNSDLVEHLKSLGFIHHGYNVDNDKELQPRWIYVLNLEDMKNEEELMMHISKPTRKNIKKTLKMGLELEEIGVEGLEEYKKITEHTGARRGFIDRPLSYYQEMFKALGDNIKIILCYLNVDKSIALLQEEIDTINSFSDITDKRKEEIKNLEKRIADLKEVEKKHGKRVTLAGSMFIACEKELLNLYGGGYDEFMKYDAMSAIQWHAIKYAKEHGFNVYNFYGIDGNLKENNSMHGVYEFKKGFNGKVVELIGEFDLPINKLKYKLYTVAFSSYKKAKNTINKIKNK